MKTRSAGIALLSALLLTMLSMLNGSSLSRERELPTVEQILDRYIEAIGGREAIEKLETRVCKLTSITNLNWTDPKVQEVQMEAFAKDPHMVLWKEHKPSGVRMEGYDGKDFWHSEGGETEVRDKPIPLKYRFIFDPRGALNIEYYFPNLSVESIETVQGRECYMLQPRDLTRTHFALYFDVETGMLTHIGYYCNAEDYREVDGVKVPFKITMSRKGGSTTFTFESIEHNVPLEDMIFAPPANKND